MKKLLIILVTIVVSVSTALSLEPMKIGFVYTGAAPIDVRVQLADNTSSSLFVGETFTGLTPNSSGVIVVNVLDNIGTAWTNFQASSVNTYSTLDIYVNGTLYAQYRLDALIMAQAQNGILDQDGNLTPSESGSGNIGTDKLRWKGAYFEGNTVHIGPPDGEADDEEMRLSYDDNMNTGSIVIDNESVMDATKDLVTVNKRVSQELGNKNVAFGRDAYNNTGTATLSTMIGVAAGGSVTNGGFNTFIGSQAAFSNTTGAQNTIIGTSSGFKNNGWSNVFVGTQSGLDNTSGGNNTYIGYNAGKRNTTGNDNTFLGNSAGDNASQKLDAQNSIAIGQGTHTTADNQVVIGNSSITETQLRGVKLMDLAGNGTENLQVDNSGNVNSVANTRSYTILPTMFNSSYFSGSVSFGTGPAGQPRLDFADGVTSTAFITFPAPTDMNPTGYEVTVLYSSDQSGGIFHCSLFSRGYNVGSTLTSFDGGGDLVIAGPSSPDILASAIPNPGIFAGNEDLINFVLRRRGGNAGDTNTGVMHVYGIIIKFTE